MAPDTARSHDPAIRSEATSSQVDSLAPVGRDEGYTEVLDAISVETGIREEDTVTLSLSIRPTGVVIEGRACRCLECDLTLASGGGARRGRGTEIGIRRRARPDSGPVSPGAPRTDGDGRSPDGACSARSEPGRDGREITGYRPDR